MSGQLRLTLFCVFAAVAFAGVGVCQADGDVPLTFTRLDLTDGRKLKNVVVKSYDAKSEKLLVVANGVATTIPIAVVPSPFRERLKSAPGAGGSVSVVNAPAQPAPRAMAAAADQYYQEAAAVNRRAAPTMIVVPSPRPPQAAAGGAAFELHQTAARARAERYFRYEFQVGSNSISVSALDFELGRPKEVTGWEGRYITQGKAFIEFYDSKGRSFQRTTSTFEITTEQKPGDGVKVIDFSRKS